MNINRFILPAAAAAVLHAALLLALPKIDLPVIGPPAKPHHGSDPVPIPEPPPEPPAEIPTEKQVAPVQKGSEVAVVPDHHVTTDSVAMTVDVRPAVYHPKPDAPLGLPGVPGGIDLDGPGTGGSPIFSPTDLDRIPRTTAQIPPNYPPAMRAAGLGGSVVVDFTVDATGRVVKADVLKSDRREFEEAAVHAVLKWRFEPGKRNGRPVPFRMVIPINFTLGAY